MCHEQIVEKSVTTLSNWTWPYFAILKPMILFATHSLTSLEVVGQAIAPMYTA